MTIILATLAVVMVIIGLIGVVMPALPGHMLILAGLITGTLYALCVVPALYSRFGAGAMPDAVTDEDLGIAV